jgi:glucan phosphoethanolaminetransferase (alkaline phosphatase superfamily)
MSANAPAPAPSAAPSSTPMGTPSSTANSLVNVNTANVDKVGVFTTAQSLLTFSGAVAAVTTIWNVLVRVDPLFGKNWVPVVLSLLIGLFIYLTSVTQDETWKDKLSSLGVSIVNSFTIAAAALGIN